MEKNQRLIKMINLCVERFFLPRMLTEHTWKLTPTDLDLAKILVSSQKIREKPQDVGFIFLLAFTENAEKNPTPLGLFANNPCI